MAAPSRPPRPTPAERRRRRTRTLALVVAVALVATLAVPLAALAAPRPGAAGAAAATSPDAETAREVLGVDVVHEVWLWSAAFLRGEEAGLQAPLDTAEQWVAGTPDGTRTAWRDPEQDRVVEAGWDDDDELARALEDLAADDRLVTDEGDWLVLGADGTVRRLLSDRLGEAPAGPTPLAEFQTLRTARWAEAVAGDGLSDGMAGGGGPPAPADDDVAGQGLLRSAVPVAVVAAMLLTGIALAVRARRERDRADRAQAAVGSTSPRSS